MDIVQVKDVSIKYDDAASAVTGADLNIRQGEIMTMIGKSGCGKSTLLKAIAGYLQPSSGEILLNGQPVTGPSWRTGVVFQNNALYPWLNVQQNIGFGLKMRHFKQAAIDQRVNELLDEVQLTGKGEEKVFALSGGMQQRVAVARGLANRPELLMFDESFGALDTFTRDDIHQVILDLWHESKITFFIITHDIDEAIKLGGRIAVMNNDGTTADIQVIDNPYFNVDQDLSMSLEYLEFKKQIQSAIKS